MKKNIFFLFFIFLLFNLFIKDIYFLIFSSIFSSFNILLLIKNIDKKKEKILNSLMEGILILDSNKKIKYFNAETIKIFGKLKKGFFLKDIKQKPSQIEDLIFLCQKKHSPIKIELSFQEKFLDIIAIPKKKETILIFKDKTLDHQGKDFIANASHELRTPITIIRGFAETLNDFPKLSKNKTKEIIKKIIKTSLELEDLIKNLLMLAKLDNLDPYNLEKNDIFDIIENIKKTFLNIYPNAQININISKNSLFIFSEKKLLELAIKNILENSIKYCSSSPNIFIKGEKIADKILLSIKDNGIGIDKKNLPFIFNKFFTLNKTNSKKHEGTGLGLSIVKNVIEKHKGIIKVYSEIDKGTTFEILLPAFKNEAPSL